MTNDDSAIEDHQIVGSGRETRVFCPKDNTANATGPHFLAASHPDYCPYCGADSGWGEHRIHDDGDEVFCPRTNMSTYRYCPACGDEVDDAG